MRLAHLPSRRLRAVLVVVLVGLGTCVPASASSSVEPLSSVERSRDHVPVGVWPLRPEPEVVAVFEPPLTPYGPGHRGVDLAGTLGQPVRAALAGRVRFAAVLAGRGVVVVDHGTTRTTYEPVVATVSVGDRVGRGDPIGLVEVAGSHCFPQVCLHWGWKRGEVYLDPLLLVGDGDVRLLPLDGEVSPSPEVRAQRHGTWSSWRPLLMTSATPLGWWAAATAVVRRGGGPGRRPGAAGLW